MKRSKIKRHTPLRAKGQSRFPQRRDPEYLAWIRLQPCCVTLGRHLGVYVVEAAHVRSRGAGGTDVGETVPFCHSHHLQQHRLGIQTFQELYELDLAALAADYAHRYAEEHEFL